MTQVLDVYEKLSLPVKPVEENHDMQTMNNVIQIIWYFVKDIWFRLSSFETMTQSLDVYEERALFTCCEKDRYTGGGKRTRNPERSRCFGWGCSDPARVLWGPGFGVICYQKTDLQWGCSCSEILSSDSGTPIASLLLAAIWESWRRRRRISTSGSWRKVPGKRSWRN